MVDRLIAKRFRRKVKGERVALSDEEQARYRQMTEAAEGGEIDRAIGPLRKPEPGEGRQVLLNAGVPEQVLDRLHLRPYEWCRQYSEGDVSRESLVYALVNLSYLPRPNRTQGLHDDLLLDDPRFVGEIMDAQLAGLIDLELATEIRAARDRG